MVLVTAPPPQSLLPEILPQETTLPGTSLLRSALPQEEVHPRENVWDPASQRYGLPGLLNCRDAMMPIAKPLEMIHFKLLVCPRSDAAEVGDADARESRRAGDRKGKGKGKDKNSKGRFIQDMGRTEVMTNTQKGQWWRNCCEQTALEVIVREHFSLQSQEIWKVPPGHFVQQSGPCEVFVSGKANGLQRMPVLPRGWVTVDATAVGGPMYLEQTRVPRWKVVFRSGSSRGDIVVREALSLESDEVAVLLYGTRVEQCGPQEVHDSIVRMPITFTEMVRSPSDPSSFSPKLSTGWVTCDATAQGGPKFFEPCVDEDEPPQTQLAPTLGASASEAPFVGGNAAGSVANSGPNTWDKNRTWKVVNLARDDRKLAVTTRAEQFAPGSGRIPPEDILVRWLSDGDIVEQVGHSKKVRGYMVMPIRVVSADSDENTSGWVTRRLVDKMRDSPDETWLVELRNGEEAERGDRRKPRRRHPPQGSSEAPTGEPAGFISQVCAMLDA